MISNRKWKSLTVFLEWALKSDLSTSEVFIEYDWTKFRAIINDNMECVLERETMCLTIRFKECTHEKRAAFIGFDGRIQDLNVDSLYYLINTSIKNAFIMYEQGVEDGRKDH